MEESDASHRQAFGHGSLSWTGAASSYDRDAEPSAGARCSIVGAEKLTGVNAKVARELEQRRQLARTDPGFECTRDTMVIMGRPVQVLLVLRACMI